MVTKINSWKPDTCTCIVHYTWDDSVPQDQIITSFFAVEDVCSNHAPLVPQTLLTGNMFSGRMSNTKSVKLDIVNKALSENEEYNRKHIQEIRDRKRFRVNGLFLNNNYGRRTVLEEVIENEEDKLLEAGLEKHRQEVIRRYENIFSSPLALAGDVYNAVKDENQRKNYVLDEILNHPDTPTSMYDIIANSTARMLKQGITYNFTWTGTGNSRVLNISFTGISIPNNRKSRYQNTLDTIFGTNKVVLL